MSGGFSTRLSLDLGVADQLMPLHLWVSPTGHIRSVGRTISKMRPGQDLRNMRLLELFEVKRPRSVRQFSDLYQLDQSRMRLAFRTAERHMMKGHYVRLPGDQGAIINLSLGVSVIDVVGQYGLSGADFAASDPTVDMLYLIEAKTLALNESKRLNARLHGQKSEAEEKAFSDTLTGLKNRRAMERAFVRLIDDPVPFGLMHLDLDHFKQVNDTLGHAAGDHVLQHVSQVLRSETRSNDLAVRVGGDEFVLIFPQCVDLDILGRIAERIIRRLEDPILYHGELCHISVSIGTTLSSYYDAPEIEQMLSDADQALYRSKKAGRARHTVFEPGDSRPCEHSTNTNYDGPGLPQQRSVTCSNTVGR